MNIAKLILDSDAMLMRNVFGMVDEKLEVLKGIIKQDVNESGDSALFDDSEYLHGIGFVTAQRYLVSTCGLFGLYKDQKQLALAVGPKVGDNIPIATLINAVANHWKHSEEWPWDLEKGDWDSKLSNQARKTIEAIEAIGVKVSHGGFVAVNVFCKLNLVKFGDLIPILGTWSNDVAAAFGPKNT
jgi:hypothetical protein